MPATMRDVARRAGVSTATVSRALAGKPHVSQEFRERVRAAAQELDYRPSRIARSLRVKRSSTMALIISDIQNPFFTSLVRGVEDVAHEHGYGVFLCNSDEDADKESLYVNLLLAERVAGVVVSATRETDSPCRKLVEADMPVVAVDRRMGDLDVDTVVVDNVDGAYQAVSHLVGLGHRRIGIIGGPLWTTTGRERLEGYRKALSQHKIELDRKLIIAGDFKQSGGYRMALGLLELDNPPSAIFAGNNLTTLGALNAIHEKGLSIPHDVAIIGFDDMPWAASLNPPLTAVAQPTYALGCTAADLLFKRLADPERQIVEVVLRTTLVVRDSCGLRRRPVGAVAGN